MPTPTRDDATPADGALLLAFFLSGAAALGYELLWTRLLGFALGSETVGVLATLAGFFGGMAIGAALLHRRAETSPDPVRLFIVLELVAAGFALVSPHLLHALAREVPPLLGPLLGAGDTSVALLLSLLIATLALLPGTICLGATLAALAAARRRAFRGEPDGRGLGRLYAANTAGATAGVLLTVYLVLPAWGYALGAAVPAALGVAAAVCARRWGAGRDLSPRTSEPASPDMFNETAVIVTGDPDGELLREPWLLYLVTFGTGLAGVGLEVVGVQVLAQNLENTVYTFANILAVYLVGTALGAAIYQRHAARALAGRPGGVTLGLLALMGALVVPVAFALQSSPTLLAALAPAHADLGRAILGELGVAAIVFLVPTMVMGALFAHVTGLIAAAGRGVGRGYALNTLGGALAPFLFGLWAIPTLGYADALYVVLYAYLAVFAVFGWFRRFHPALLVGGVLVLIALTAAGPRSLALLTDDPGWTTLDQRETLHGLVLVRERADNDPARKRADGQPASKRPDGQPAPLRRLQVGHHFRMGGALSFGEQRMGQLCAMLAASGEPQRPVQRAMFLGLGTGATMGAALDVLPEVRADGVELVPEVLGLLHRFADINHDLHKNPRATLVPADARRFVVASPDRYDLVLADLFHPGQDGAGSLYAEEHFIAVREHLRPGAPFCQWLPLHQLGPAELRGVVRTFLGVYPETHAFLGLYNAATPALALIGRVPTAEAPQLRLDLARLRPLTRQPGVTIVDPRDLLASYMADGTALAAWAGEGPINTDLRPRILFDAPAAAYADDAELGARNLESLLALRPADPGVLLTGAGAEALREPARRHAEAATLYLRAELARGPISDLKQLPPESAELAIQAYEADPEFAPARGSLYAIVRGNPQLAELVLPRMLARTPDEPRVHQALLAHLQSIGDRARFDAALQAAQARFPQPASP